MFWNIPNDFFDNMFDTALNTVAISYAGSVEILNN